MTRLRASLATLVLSASAAGGAGCTAVLGDFDVEGPEAPDASRREPDGGDTTGTDGGSDARGDARDGAPSLDGGDGAAPIADAGGGGGGDADAGCGATGCTTVVSVAPGTADSCALLSTGAVWCWGAGFGGALGDGKGAISVVPVRVQGIGDATAVASGRYFSCALVSGGKVKCWGTNDKGQLGGAPSDAGALSPVAVSGVSNVVEIAVGLAFACARITDGTVKCWGQGTSGELGDGRGATESPVTVSNITTAQQITCGGNHACARLAGGTVSCWGTNADRQLGPATTAQTSLVPIDVTGLSGVTTVSSGVTHTCAVVTGGTVKCWGGNRTGALGDGSLVTSATPVTALGITAVDVSAGGELTCARLADGTASCSGNAADGQLGNATRTSTTRPAAPVFNLTGVTVLRASALASACAVSNGKAWCWGNNAYAELGDGTTTNSPVPVPVAAGW